MKTNRKHLRIDVEWKTNGSLVTIRNGKARSRRVYSSMEQAFAAIQTPEYDGAQLFVNGCPSILWCWGVK
jgi:hypothetical protein